MIKSKDDSFYTIGIKGSLKINQSEIIERTYVRQGFIAFRSYLYYGQRVKRMTSLLKIHQITDVSGPG